MTTLRIHRDNFPQTDHGFTWVEFYWFEDDQGERVSAVTPCAGACERLGNLPGGPINTAELFALDCADRKPSRTVKSDKTHDGFHRVGSVCISPA